MLKNNNDIVIFFIITSTLLLGLVAFIVLILYLHRKKQILFLQNLEQVKLDYEKNMLAAQLEIQESTFQNISREIHDNINLSLTLAKLQLNTLNLVDTNETKEKINSSIELLSKSIIDLSDISKSLNADIITQQGLINALEDEIKHIRQVQLFNIESCVTGNPVYFDAKIELIIFRIIQESLNNIIKHAGARKVDLTLHYDKNSLQVTVKDDGSGFDNRIPQTAKQAGLKNMETRAKTLGGFIDINTQPGKGTILSLTIPIIN